MYAADICQAITHHRTPESIAQSEHLHFGRWTLKKLECEQNWEREVRVPEISVVESRVTVAGITGESGERPKFGSSLGAHRKQKKRFAVPPETG